MKTNKINKKSDFKVIDIFTLFSDGVSFEDFLSYLNNHGGIDAVSERGTSAFLECIINYNNVMVDFPFCKWVCKTTNRIRCRYKQTGYKWACCTPLLHYF